jgi:arylsulfatase A-like enzyme
MPCSNRDGHHLTRRDVLRGVGLGAAGALAAGCMTRAMARGEMSVPPQASARKPNIIFILADDLGYGDLGCYGQKKVRTPNIDALAADGMRFTQVYSGSTVCAPSRCALMTGLHTGHCQVRGNARVPLRPEDRTVAEVLKAAGYTTAIIGKWGLGEPDTTGIPTRKGFNYWFGYLNQRHAHNSWPTYLWRNEGKVPLKNVVPHEDPFGAGVASEKKEFSNDLFTIEALAFVERSKDKPFFLYLTYTIPHANNEAGKDGMEVPSDEPYSAENWPQVEKNFAAAITRMDTDIGKLLAMLKRLGIDENTVVFFSSDNGSTREGGHDPTFFRSGGPLRGIKRDLYDGGIRVPMIVRRPGRVKAGSVSDQVWAFWDFLPTAAEIAGAKPPAGIDGLSMLPAIEGRPQAGHEYLYWEFHEGGFSQAVRMGDWKGVRRAAGATELYNLRDDLGETKDVAAGHPDVVKRIEEIFRTARTDSPDFPVRKAPAK